jgi:lipopolysaccharide export system protein LptC
LKKNNANIAAKTSMLQQHNIMTQRLAITLERHDIMTQRLAITTEQQFIMTSPPDIMLYNPNAMELLLYL